MSYQCENCQSLFFKTLETRLCAEQSAILYKKRCKRCKYKYLVRKSVPHGQIAHASREEWLRANKVSLPSAKAAVSERAQILVGEYTRKISGPADVMLPYLQQIRRAEQRGGAVYGAP